MARQRQIEVFSAGCAVCEDTVKLVEELACSDCNVSVLDMNDPVVTARARSLGVRAVPAVAVDGVLAACCTVRGPDREALSAAGIGRPVT